MYMLAYKIQLLVVLIVVDFKKSIGLWYMVFRAIDSLPVCGSVFRVIIFDTSNIIVYWV